MRNVFTMIGIVLLCTQFAFSQKLDYRIFNEPYVELTGAWHEQPIVRYDSSFRSLKTAIPFTFSFNEIISDDIYIYGPAYVNAVDFSDTSFIEVATFYPFTTYKLVDKSVPVGQTAYLSKLSHKTEVVNAEKVFKIEWKNMGFLGCTAQDSLNMQVWLFEKSHKVQFRYGKSNMTSLNILNSIDTPVIGLELETLNDYYYASFNGTPSTGYTWGYQDPTGRSIGIPTEGTVFEIISTETPVSVISNRKEAQFLIKRNKNIIDVVVKNSSKSLNYIKVLNATGKEVLFSAENKIDIENLPQGLYVICVALNNEFFYEKFLR